MHEKQCSRCRLLKPIKDFNKDSSQKDGLKYECRECSHIYWAKYREIHREELNAAQQIRAANNREGTHTAERKSRLKHTYGLTPETFEEMRIQQSNTCPICLREFKFPKGKSGPSIDHIHGSEPVIIRGLLCVPCNTALGKLQDDVPRILRMAEYVNKFRS